MNETSKDGSRHVTDEVINTVTHTAGAAFSLLGMVFLIVQSAIYGSVWHVVGFSIYGASLFLLFLASAFHHGIDGSDRLNAFFRLFDYLSIFILIAGTYTPLCLVLSRDSWGWSTFGVVWLLAGAGVTIKAVFPSIPKWFTNTLYICMGWIGAALIIHLIPKVGLWGVSMILLGGILYSVGAVIFYIEKPNPIPGKFGFHEIWHLFVLGGAAIHYLFMFYIVLPY
ncbi:MAG: hemolysin III family protein [Spirochaetales bacterium]|nr:hemolysin III family protein [Spirochaetales bacterium]